MKSTRREALRSDARLRKAFLVLLAFFLGMSLWMVICQPIRKAVAFAAIDDAMYYPKIGYNIATRGRCTYDGATLTNGFHPLWMLLIVPVCLLVPNPFVGLKVIFAGIMFILLLCFAMLHRIGKRLQFTISGVFLAFFVVFLNMRSFTIFYSLLESHVVLFMYLLYVWFSLTTGAKRFERPREAFLSGVIIGGAFLARLDSFLLAFAYGTEMLARTVQGRQHWKSMLRAALSSSLGAGLLALPYLAINLVFFGHLSTVSAWVKACPPSWRSIRIVARWTYFQFIPRFKHALGISDIPSGAVLALLCVAMLAALTFLLTGQRRIRLAKQSEHVRDFLVFAVLHLIFIVSVAPGDAVASAWYLVPEIVAMGLVVGMGTPDCAVRRWRIIPTAVVCLLVLQGLWYPKYLQRKAMSFAKLEAAEFIRTNTEQNVRGAMYDSGIVSFFSERDFVSLNGLIGDFEMAEMVKRGDKKALAATYGIGLLVLDVPRGSLPAYSNSVLYETRITSKFTNFQEAPKPFVVYRISPEDLEQIWRARFKK